jgi:FMN phosphatase YigB (HAD superfamily)
VLVFGVMSEIKAVIFDLGETLLNYGRVDVNVLFREGGRLTYDYLGEIFDDLSRRVSFSRYARRHLLSIRGHILKANLTCLEFDCLWLLDKLLRGYGLIVDGVELEALARLWYRPLGERGKIEDGLAETLEGLRERRYQLAILSNTFLPGVVLDEHLDRYGLLDYFEHRVYSSQIHFRKPRREAFGLVLDRLGVLADEAVMVGDHLRMDIGGARKSGLRFVFKRGVVNRDKRVPKDVPVVDRISELGGLLGRMSGGVAGL